MSKHANQHRQESKLVVTLNDFKTKLSEQLEKGKQLLYREIADDSQLEELKRDYKSWTIYTSEYLKHAFSNPRNEYKENFDNEGYTFMGRIGRYFNEVSDYKDLIGRRVDNLTNLITVADLLKLDDQGDAIKVNSQARTKAVSSDEVFIVHGHDEVAKIKAARFIEKLGFKPIILHEQSSSGKTIIEKIEEYTNVGFAIVLYTPCDIGGKKKENPSLTDRARQNVVFEHGYLIGKIGRNNVCALVKGNIETPTDISGVVYVSMDDSEAWHLMVAKEMRSSGYSVDINKL